MCRHLQIRLLAIACITFAGTYSGIVEKLGYLKRLGVNAIELLPVHEFNELEYYAVRIFNHPAPVVMAHKTCHQNHRHGANLCVESSFHVVAGDPRDR